MTQRLRRYRSPCSLALTTACLVMVTGPTGLAQPAEPPREQPAAGAPDESSKPVAAGLPWPERAAISVRDLDVGPWRLVRVRPWRAARTPADDAAAELLAGALGVDTDRIVFEGAGSILVRTPDSEISSTARFAGKPAAVCEVVSGAETADAEFLLERTTFALYEPRHGMAGDGAEATSRGLIVFLPGMFGEPVPIIDTLIGQWRSDGWHVLRMLTHPSRFTQRATYELQPGGEFAEQADEIAGVLGDRAAECALALEAVCDHLATTMNDVPFDRRMAVGISGGGMVLPTVVAREPETYRGMVLIGAGCDFAEIAIESNYSDWIDAVRVEWAGEPSPEDRRRFADAYRSAAPFDSYNTAPMVAHVPALMLHGSVDKAVPAATGELLWARLGEPERWATLSSHEVLSLVYLPARSMDMLGWMNETMAAVPNP